jgi:1,2-diacylglycerol 3-beta-galactosyltransferase
MPRKVLILMSDTGGGHRSAAEAISEAMEHLYPGEYDVKVVDVFASFSRVPLTLSATIYALATRYSPRLWGWFWHLSNLRCNTTIGMKIASWYVSDKVERMLDQFNPDAVASVHPILSHLVGYVLRKTNLPIPLTIVVTDLVDLHWAWIYREANCYIVPTVEARRAVLERGIPPHMVKLVGVPVGLAFSACKESKLGSRTKLGLNPKSFTVLMLGGSEGTGQIYDYALAISEAKLDLQLIIIAGRNQALKRKLERIEFTTSAKVYGFVNNMPELMHSADLIITRAGPGIVSEALACGLPILVTGCLPGQEEGNIRYVTNNNAGILVTSPHQLVETLRRLMENRATELAVLAQNAARLGKANAALEIARFVAASLQI